MAVRVKLARPSAPSGKPHSIGYRIVRVLAVLFLACLVVGASLFGYDYFKYQKIVDKRLAAGPIFANVSQIYAAPREVRVGQHLTVQFIAQQLRRASYNTDPQLGTFELNGNSIRIKPGPESYHSTDGATITSGPSSGMESAAPVATGESTASAGPGVIIGTGTGDVVLSITADNGAPLAAYQLEPQLITALSEDKSRTKRRLVTYDEIPKQMVQAVTAIEDRRFFEHGGVDYVRIAKCAVHDILVGRMACGASTLTQQLAKNFFLTPDKTISRKIDELMITYQLEDRFTKPQIFEMYANEVNIGRRGSFEINGFGEAAQSFFGKDLRQLDLAECATIAGLIQNPSRRNPYTHPDRAVARRNVVLDSMVETGAITAAEAERAKAEPLHLAPPNIDAAEAPYFVDLVHDQLVKRISDQELGHDSLRIYTSLDPELQRAAAAAVQEGMKSIDELVRRRYFALHHKKGERFNKDAKPDGPITYPQVALVALNPHTGQVLALIGGRDYGVSQLDHALSERPTGSTFKPFVYATAFNTSLNGTDLDGDGVFTALTRLDDDPQVFMFNGKPYSPGNFVRGEYPGMVTAAQALAHSLNIATISLAQKVGYDNVAALARSAGIVNARGTPSVAIGTYAATPLDMAGAYTVFANAGVHITPWMLASVRSANGDIVADFTPEAKQVMDPRAAFLTQSLLEGVINYGTAEPAIRGHGFTAPAAGKTGTEHDAWFAGYSSNLLCIVWIGNDDYTDLKIQGADAAAPIWADFMKRAILLPQYSDMKPFTPPDGVQMVKIDRNTWLPADATCPDDYMFAFLDGTVPTGTCSHMTESPQSLGQLLGTPTPVVNQAAPGSHPTAAPARPSPAPSAPPANPPPAQPADNGGTTQPKKKRNIFQKIFGLGKKPPEQASPPPQ